MVSPRIAVIDATVSHTELRFRGMAARYVQWEIEQSGGEIAEAKNSDVVAVTIVAPHEYEYLPRALKRNGVEPLAAQRRENGGPVVVLGGQGALSPAVFDPYIDVACVGEGRTFIKSLVSTGVDGVMQLPNAWVPGEARVVIPDEEFPWDAPPIISEDGVVRIYASRGCHKKCLFCQTGWANTYRENDSERLMRQYRKLVAAGYRVNVVTNDAPALSFFDEMDVLEHFSASYSQTLELISDGGIAALAGKVRQVRFGVESPSSRLRRWIGKPIDTPALYDLSVRLLNAGVGVRWFMIAGLPGEVDEDYDELREVVRLARHDVKKGALQLSFTAFCPDPAAPLCVAPLDDSYAERFDAFKAWFFERGYTRKVAVFKCAGAASRLRHAMGSMAATEDELRRGWLDRDPPNWRVRYPLADRVTTAYNVYARRAGLPPRLMP